MSMLHLDPYRIIGEARALETAAAQPPSETARLARAEAVRVLTTAANDRADAEQDYLDARAAHRRAYEAARAADFSAADLEQLGLTPPTLAH
ncbi:hypothetical protein [Herbiconiux flava]|uniref:Uncharacterized protein n=1 Tax=Herbiconiux flava TaxID=881268 RepID=A0A852SQ88_9MICO|nr:hypothetical protein [Herbiconiux flava]NYD70944.1 hypothetical protein [Herbiconiux flava]GLK19094.1 hypothetical protein GCM10017602_35760 [Herbiconiux flava]